MYLKQANDLYRCVRTGKMVVKIRCQIRIHPQPRSRHFTGKMG